MTLSPKLALPGQNGNRRTDPSLFLRFPPRSYLLGVSLRHGGLGALVVWAAAETREGVRQEERGWKGGKAAVFLWPGLLCSTQRGLVWSAAWMPQS